jgi:hypothetical protein
MSRLTLLLLLTIFGSFASPPSRALAQEDITLRVIPRFGLLHPDTYFYEEFANFADDEPTEWTTGAMGRAAYVGLGFELGWEGRGLLFRGEAGRSFEGWLFATHGLIRPRVLFEPPEIVNTFLDVPASVTFASAQLILPVRLSFWGINPYLLLGGGGKWYHFGEPEEPNTVDAILPSDGFTAAADLGVGLFVDLWKLTFDFQARDALNQYWDKTQHDLVFTGGLVWTIR